jgi:hypothetical protein
MNWTRRGNDRRRDIRFEVLGSLRGNAPSAQNVQVRNIAKGGALIEGYSPFPLNTRVCLKVSGSIEVHLEARIRRVTSVLPTGYLIGVEFVDTNPIVLRRLEGLIASLG